MAGEGTTFYRDFKRGEGADPTAGWTAEQWRDQAFFQAGLVAALNREAMRLLGVIAQAAAAMQAMHPDAPSDLSDADYARLWNATADMLEAETRQ